jgi:hypothetical protein
VSALVVAAAVVKQRETIAFAVVPVTKEKPVVAVVVAAAVVVVAAVVRDVELAVAATAICGPNGVAAVAAAAVARRDSDDDCESVEAVTPKRVETERWTTIDSSVAVATEKASVVVASVRSELRTPRTMWSWKPSTMPQFWVVRT